MTSKYRVLELYAGIGGMHFALKASGVDFEVAQALEINPSVLDIYRHNFPDTKLHARNINGVTADELNSLKIDVIVMSPPCQPFCRSGNKLGMDDNRSSSLAHVLSLLPAVHFKYLLLENVKGFETSKAREAVIETLTQCGMHIQEFLLSPATFGIPNKRPRYYLIARKTSNDWSFEACDTILNDLPKLKKPAAQSIQNVMRQEEMKWLNFNGDCSTRNWKVGDVLESSVDLSEYTVPLRLIEKYGESMDLVDADSTSTNCFTKGYGTYLKGTGSYIPLQSAGTQEDSVKRFRYLTPREIARLMCYPDDFVLPPRSTKKQLYRALGNSINVYVVALLVTLLLAE